MTFETGSWQSADGLTLRYRDYTGPADRPPIICIPGLTRNARDFEPVAHAFAGTWRLICVDLRGRGESDYAKNPATYQPAQYAADIAALFDALAIKQAVMLGTSLGGIVTMLLAPTHGDRIAAAVLNDIGPDIEAEGLSRIKDYVGQGRSYPTWMHAAWALKESSADIYPEAGTGDWLQLAKRAMCVSAGGRITLDYDMKIAEPFSAPPPETPFDMWPAFRALAERPLLTLRGERSDILSPAKLAQMQADVPAMEAVTVPAVGHPPTLDEPVALAAIARLLEKVA